MLAFKPVMRYKITRVKPAGCLSYPLTDNLIYWRYDVMAEPTLTKLCTKCKVEKSIDEFSRRKDEHRFWCRACAKSYYQSHQEETLAQKKQYYQDNKEEKKALSNKYYEDNKEAKKAYAEQYRKDNREKINEYLKQYYIDNEEDQKVQRKQYYKDNKVEITTLRKRYRKDNKAYISEWMKQYQQTPNGKAASKKNSHKRRAQKAGVGYENFNPNNIFKRDGYRCQLCGKKTRPDYNRFHPLFPNLDHIVPLNKGGSHTKKNTQCLCRLCNMIKHDTGKGDQLRLFG